MRESLTSCWVHILAVGVSFVSVFGVTTLLAEDPDPAKCCNNQVFAAFFWPGGIGIAVSSQGINKVLFSKSKFAEIHFQDGVLADPNSRFGNHAATCIFTEINPPGNGDLVMTPQLFFALDLLPQLPPMVGRQPKGTLTAIYAGYKIRTINGWYPEETKLGLFGATFSTQVSKTPASDGEFIRLPTDGRHSASAFSLPLDLVRKRHPKFLNYSNEISMLPCAVYEDFGFTEWII